MAINHLTDLKRGVTLTKHLPSIFMGLLSCVPLWITLHLYRFSYDDAYITFRYARNIAEGHGFAYNVGNSYLGTTTPLYAILLAALSKLLPFLSVPEIGGLVSGLSLTFCGWFIYLTAKRFNQALVGILSTPFIFLNPLLVMTFGGEALVFLMLISGAFYFYFAKRGYLTTLFLALALLTRGDGAIPALVVAGHYLFAERKIPWKPLILFFLIISPWFLYSLFTFGSVLPATMEAKVAQGKSGLWMTFPRGAWEWLKGFLLNDRRYAVIIPMAVVGIIYILISGKPWSLFLIWVTLFAVGYTFLGVPFYHWYVAPLGLMLAILIALGGMATPGFLKNLFELINDWCILRREMPNDGTMMVLNPKLNSIRRNRIRVYFLSLALVALCAVLVIAAELKSVAPLLHRDHIDAREEIYTRVSRWLSENTEPNATVAYLEIGYLGYYTDRKIIDLLGLVSPEIGSHIRESNFAWGFLRYEPDYYIYNPNFACWTKVIDQEPWFRAAYERVAEISGAGYPPLTIYKKKANASLPDPLEIDVAQLKHTAPAGEIFGENTVGQTFVSREANLNGIEVMLATYNRKNTKPVIFHLRESPRSSVDIFREEIAASDVIDNAWHLFQFPLLKDSKGKSYYFYLESPESTPGDAITAWMSSTDAYDGGALMKNHEPARGDLAFKTYYVPE